MRVFLWIKSVNTAAHWSSSSRDVVQDFKNNFKTKYCLIVISINII